MFKINTEAELYNFLKILSEESVKKSKRMLVEESDPYSDYYLKKRSEEKKMFEQDQAEEEEEDDGQTGAPPVEEPDESSGESEETEPENTEDQPEESDSSQEAFFASKDRLVDFVNDIRSAPSIKDSAVSDQIDAYYDRLSEEERNVLVFFLRELSKVMTGKASGADARDPSDPPLNIDFVPKGEEDASSEVEKEEPSEKSDTPEPEQELSGDEFGGQQSSDEEEEDTTAPIKVNESQDHRHLRKKIRQLMS